MSFLDPEKIFRFCYRVIDQLASSGAENGSSKGRKLIPLPSVRKEEDGVGTTEEEKKGHEGRRLIPLPSSSRDSLTSSSSDISVLESDK